MRRTRLLSLLVPVFVSVFGQAHAQEPSFADRLVLDPDETCSGGAPEPGDIVALALRGAKGRNYVLAGNNDVARLAVRGPATTAYSVFEITGTVTENTVAIHSLGHTRFVELDRERRAFATAAPAAAIPLVFEETGDGYFRIRMHGHQIWMRMNENGYLDFRTGDVAAASQFCAQRVVAG